MPRCALPEHIDEANEWKGTDWDNPIQRPLLKIQHWFKFGHRCPPGLAWMMWFIPWTPIIFFVIPVARKWRRYPKLLLGYNVNRWMADSDKSVLFIAPYTKTWFFPWTRTTDLPATEMKDSNENFNEPILVQNLAEYGPSPIQYWSDFHFQITWPLHVVISVNVKRKNKKPFRLFFRWGCRWDSGDMYFVAPAFTAQTDFN